MIEKFWQKAQKSGLKRLFNSISDLEITELNSSNESIAGGNKIVFSRKERSKIELILGPCFGWVGHGRMDDQEIILGAHFLYPNSSGIQKLITTFREFIDSLGINLENSLGAGLHEFETEFVVANYFLNDHFSKKHGEVPGSVISIRKELDQIMIEHRASLPLDPQNNRLPIDTF